MFKKQLLIFYCKPNTQEQEITPTIIFPQALHHDIELYRAKSKDLERNCSNLEIQSQENVRKAWISTFMSMSILLSFSYKQL